MTVSVFGREGVAFSRNPNPKRYNMNSKPLIIPDAGFWFWLEDGSLM